MVFIIVQILAIILGAIGTLLTIVVTSMSQWRVSYMVEGNALNCDKRIDGQWLSRWDGLWVTCITKNQNNMHCSSYDSLVSITTDLKAGRVLMSFAVVISIIALIIAIVALVCIRCCRGVEAGRFCMLLTAGIGFILAAILVLIPVSWVTSNIIKEINNPMCKTIQRQEIGEAIFLGWPTVFFLLIAGIILCWCFPRFERCDSVDYSSECTVPRPVYGPCQTQEHTLSQTHYSKSQYI
ncbi:claudin-8-like [Bombina bombina]|uniref:claudin-8-like n=1 Tax=Bombina bombina TaxID=8345 RepID=UPI00235A742E|nr:claudin-8-like [Bombina bombina]